MQTSKLCTVNNDVDAENFLPLLTTQQGYQFIALTTTQRTAMTFVRPTLQYDTTIGAFFFNPSSGVFIKIIEISYFVSTTLPGQPILQVGNSTTTGVTTSTTETQISNYTLPSIFTTGKNNVVYWGSGSYINTVPDNVVVRAYVNTVLINELQITSFPSGFWEMTLTIIRYSTTGLRCICTIIADGTVSTKAINIVFAVGNTIPISIRGQASIATSSVTSLNSTLNAAKAV